MKGLPQNFWSIFTFWHRSDKANLSKKLEDAKKEHENQQKQEELLARKKFLEQLKHDIVVTSALGDFDKNRSFITEHSTKLSEEEKKEIQQYAFSEEMKFLSLKFKQLLKEKDYEKAQSLLADIHIRVNDKDYTEYENMLLSVQKRTWLSSLRDEWQREWQQIGGIFSKQTSSASSLKKKESVNNIQDSKQESENESKKNLNSFLKQKVHNKLSHFQKVIDLLKKEHKGEKVDPFLLTEQVTQRGVEEKILKNTGEKKLPEENISEFESIFGVTTENEKDILDTLLEQKNQESSAKDEGGTKKILGKEKFEILDEEEEEIEYVNPFLSYVNTAMGVMLIGVSSLVLSWLFFFIQTDFQNTVLGYFAQANLYIQKEEKVQELQDLKSNIQKVKQQLDALEEGNKNIPAEIALNEIQLQKIDWIQVREHLYEATLQAFQYNDVLHYIRYSSFTGNADKKTINVSGEISDPSGRVFLMLSKLVNAINLHPSFSGAEVRTFAKTENAESDEIEGFSTNFSLTLQYLDVIEEEEKEQ